MTYIATLRIRLFLSFPGKYANVYDTIRYSNLDLLLQRRDEWSRISLMFYLSANRCIMSFINIC